MGPGTCMFNNNLDLHVHVLGRGILCINTCVLSIPTGHGPYLESKVFTTAPPGRPGSPSHVTGTWLSDDQEALVCWEPSEVGRPFLSYTIEVLELKSNVTKIWKLSVDVVMDNLPNCTAGYSVSGLNTLLA